MKLEKSATLPARRSVGFALFSSIAAAGVLVFAGGCQTGGKCCGSCGGEKTATSCSCENCQCASKPAGECCGCQAGKKVDSSINNTPDTAPETDVDLLLLHPC